MPCDGPTISCNWAESLTEAIPPFRCFSRGTKSIAVEKAGFGVARKPAFAYIAATVFKFPPGAAYNGTSVHLSHGRPQQGLWQRRRCWRTSTSPSTPTPRSVSSARTAPVSPPSCSIMAGLDKEYTGEAWLAEGATLGYLGAGAAARRELRPCSKTSWKAWPPRRRSSTATTN